MSSQPPLIVDYREYWKHIEITLSGHFMVSTLRIFTSKIRPLLSKQNKKLQAIVFDLTGLLSIDSSAIAMILNIQRNHAPVFVFGSCDSIAETFNRIGIGTVLVIYPDREAYVNDIGFLRAIS